MSFRADAQRDAHVRPFRENSGNAGMVARELPSDEVLASWQHVEQRALDPRAAGMPGSLRELRIRAYLDLRQERDSRDLPAAPAVPTVSAADAPVPGDQAHDDHAPDGCAPDGRAPDQDSVPNQPPLDSEPPGDDPDGPGSDGLGGSDGPGGPGRNGPPGPGPAAGPGPGASAAAGPSLAALVTITIPLATLPGRSETPGEADGFGPLGGGDARDLAAAARHPRTRWCITALNPDGTAAAHACLRGRHPRPALGLPGPGPS